MKLVYRIWIVSVLFLLPVFSYAQFQFKTAQTSYGHYELSKAIKKYKRKLKNNTTDGDALFNLANGYRLQGNTLDAEYWFARAVEHNAKPECKLYYAQMLLSNGKYLKAKDWFERYARVAYNKNDYENAMGIAKYCQDISENGIKYGNYEIRKTPFNSDKLDFSPMYYRDSTLLFASNREGTTSKIDPWTDDSFVKLYSVPQNENIDSLEAKYFDVDLKYHVGSVVFNADYSVAYFTATDYEKGRGYDEERNTRLHIYRAEWNGSKWDNIKSLEFNSHEYSSCHPALSPNGDSLVFSSDRPGGFGGMDLYICTVDGETVSIPENLGLAINTSGNEVFPYWHKNGKLNFSSDLQVGIGGLDIFIAEKEKGKWANPKNIGAPINSPKDDFGFIYDDNFESGYFSSDRGGEGDDIYSFVRLPIEPPIANVDMLLVSKYATDVPIDPRENDINVDGDTLVVTTFCKVSEQGGTVRFNAKRDSVLYTPPPGYVGEDKVCYTICDRMNDEALCDSSYIEIQITDEIISEQLRVGQSFVLENIYYDLDKYNIRTDAIIDLDKVVKVMRENPTLKVELSSHTDCRASHEYNETLSQNRAISATKYIVERGIAADRIVAKGYGERVLTNRCADGVECTEEEHQANRRTEIKVLEL